MLNAVLQLSSAADRRTYVDKSRMPDEGIDLELAACEQRIVDRVLSARNAEAAGGEAQAWVSPGGSQPAVCPLQEKPSRSPRALWLQAGIQAVLLALDNKGAVRELATFEDQWLQNEIGLVTLSPDGRLLMSPHPDGHEVWNLPEIRQKLAEMGLNWDHPPYDPPPRPGRWWSKSSLLSHPRLNFPFFAFFLS